MQLETREYQTPEELAGAYGVSPETLRRWARLGCPHRRLGLRKLGLRRADVDHWLATRLAMPATEAEVTP